MSMELSPGRWTLSAWLNDDGDGAGLDVRRFLDGLVLRLGPSSPFSLDPEFEVQARAAFWRLNYTLLPTRYVLVVSAQVVVRQSVATLNAARIVAQAYSDAGARVTDVAALAADLDEDGYEPVGARWIRWRVAPASAFMPSLGEPSQSERELVGRAEHRRPAPTRSPAATPAPTSGGRGPLGTLTETVARGRGWVVAIVSGATAVGLLALGAMVGHRKEDALRANPGPSSAAPDLVKLLEGGVILRPERGQRFSVAIDGKDVLGGPWDFRGAFAAARRAAPTRPVIVLNDEGAASLLNDEGAAIHHW